MRNLRNKRTTEALTTLQTETVSNAIAAAKIEVALGDRPPPIHASEETLSRQERNTLAPLGAGYSKHLNS